VIDADTHEVSHRLQQLQAVLDGERIAHLIPKRNIETWVLCLNDRQPNGQPVNEDEDYKHHNETRNIDELIKPAAAAFFAWTRPNAVTPAYCVPSLRSAIPEVRRIE
jgi:hypothetical protein